MKFTDACIRPYPLGDSSLGRMALECRELGYDSAIALGGDALAREELGAHGIQVLKGYCIEEKSAKGVTAACRRAPGDRIIMVEAGEYAFNRAVISIPGIKILRGLWRAPSNAVDHVLARFAAQRRVAWDIELNPLVRTRGHARQRAIQRYRDILMLHRRLGVPLTISTGAASVLEQRGVRDAMRLCALFGMGQEEVYRALGTMGLLLRERRDVEVIGWAGDRPRSD
ncbi:MAG: RNase P subunit p30 family protein [Methanomicrobiales archaeon]|nr:RNase P subunit p30 family protein [Methanomicrobiales archaeon]